MPRRIVPCQEANLHRPRRWPISRQHSIAICVHCAWRVNALPLAALADDGDPHRRAELTLDRVYIALDTTTQAPIEEATKAAGKAQRRRLREGFDPDRKTRIVPALEAAATQPRLVILGDPGSGKSTFTNYLGYLLAGARLGEIEPIEGWPHGPLLPVRLLLRDLVRCLACRR